MTAALSLAPALLIALTLLALTLLARRFPGERALARVAGSARRRQPRRRPSRAQVAWTATHSLLPRGGALLASPLAVRPPPRALHAS